MPRAATLLIIAAFVVLGGALILVRDDTPGPSVSREEGTRIEAPGTRVETDRDGTRVQAPGVDITVPKNKDEN